jgi:hypothetical protein
MTLFFPYDNARTMDFNANDVGYVPSNAPLYVENTSTTDIQNTSTTDIVFLDDRILEGSELTRPVRRVLPAVPVA